MWGVDESLLAGVAAGAQAAVGSSYNYAAPVYGPVVDYAAAGGGLGLRAAREAQERARQMQEVINAAAQPRVS